MLVLDDYHLVDDEQIHESVVTCSSTCPRRAAGAHHARRTRRSRSAADARPRPAAGDPAAGSALQRHRGSRTAERRARPQARRRADRAPAAAHRGLGGRAPARRAVAARARRRRRPSSRSSRATTASSSTTSARRCSIGQPPRSARVPAAHGDPRADVRAAVRSADRRRGRRRDAADVERENLFVVALDSTRRWYRYHHLFGDLLRHDLEAAEPGLVTELHARAASWFAEQGRSPTRSITRWRPATGRPPSSWRATG